MYDARDKALELVEEGVVSAEYLLTACLKYMSIDDVEDMLDCNELSERFMDDDEPDVDEAQEWADFGEVDYEPEYI